MVTKKSGSTSTPKPTKADMHVTIHNLGLALSEHRQELANQNRDLVIMVKQSKSEHADSTGKLVAAVAQMERNIHGNSELLKSREILVEATLNDIARKCDVILRNMQSQTKAIEIQNEYLKNFMTNFSSAAIAVVGLLGFVLYRLFTLYK